MSEYKEGYDAYLKEEGIDSNLYDGLDVAGATLLGMSRLKSVAVSFY